MNERKNVEKVLKKKERVVMVDERSEMREEGGGKGENKGKRKWKEGELKSIGNKKEKKD